MIFETEHLMIRRATPAMRDVEFFMRLWNDQQIVGLQEPDYILDKLNGNMSGRVWNKKLIVILKEENVAIGECMMGEIGDEGTSDFDLKLLPEYRDKGYAIEVMPEIINFLFSHSDSVAVVGMSNSSKTEDVPGMSERISRNDWEKNNRSRNDQ